MEHRHSMKTVEIPDNNIRLEVLFGRYDLLHLSDLTFHVLGMTGQTPVFGRFINTQDNTPSLYHEDSGEMSRIAKKLIKEASRTCFPINETDIDRVVNEVREPQIAVTFDVHEANYHLEENLVSGLELVYRFGALTFFATTNYNKPETEKSPAIPGTVVEVLPGSVGVVGYLLVKNPFSPENPTETCRFMMSVGMSQFGELSFISPESRINPQDYVTMHPVFADRFMRWMKSSLDEHRVTLLDYSYDPIVRV